MSNAYRTPHMRARSQVTQRRFDVVAGDQRVTFHGVKGANGEWMLERHIGGSWVPAGIAYREARGWVLVSVSGARFPGATLSAVLVSAAVDADGGE